MGTIEKLSIPDHSPKRTRTPRAMPYVAFGAELTSLTNSYPCSYRRPNWLAFFCSMKLWDAPVLMRACTFCLRSGLSRKIALTSQILACLPWF